MHTHETQSRRESCVFSFSHLTLILYTALHKRLLSTIWQCLLQFPIIIIIIIIIIKNMLKKKKKNEIARL